MDVNGIDILRKCMENSRFSTDFPDHGIGKRISLVGKDNDGYYSVGITTNCDGDGDFAIYFFSDYDRMIKWLNEYGGETYYDYISDLHVKRLSEKLGD